MAPNATTTSPFHHFASVVRGHTSGIVGHVWFDSTTGAYFVGVAHEPGALLDTFDALIAFVEREQLFFTNAAPVQVVSA